MKFTTKPTNEKPATSTMHSRRSLLKTGTFAALAVPLGSAFISSRARAQQKTLKIMQWKHFVAGHDDWFATFAKSWGKNNDTNVSVDYVGLGDIGKRAETESNAGKGHDLVMLLAPPSVYEDQVIDHRELYEECQRLYGPAPEFAIKNTFNPKTKKYFGFCTAYLPSLLTYRHDLWQSVGVEPNTWEDVLKGGRRIRLQFRQPNRTDEKIFVGISLAKEHNCNHTLRAIMNSYGASVQDEDANPALKSQATLESIKLVKALYEQAMDEEVLSWTATSNNEAMLSRASLTVDTVSIIRAAERKRTDMSEKLRLRQIPEGPAGRKGPSFGIMTYFIWKSAENAEGAKKFLIDLVSTSRGALQSSGFQNLPVFSKSVPQIEEVLAGGGPTSDPNRYGVLAEGSAWTTNIGYPGNSNGAIGQVFSEGLIPQMFANAATGRMSPESALDEADAKVRAIFGTWKERGKI